MYQNNQLLRIECGDLPDAAPTIDNYSLIREYLDWKASYTTAAASAYELWVRRFQEFTSKAPEAMAIGDWVSFAANLQGRFAPKAVQFALNVVHNYLRFWHEQGRLRIPLYLLRVPKAVANSHQAISEGDYQLLVEVLKKRRGLRDLALIMLLHDTGMRVGELVRIEIDQVEEDASTDIRTEKTVAKRRVFWSRETHEVLERYVVQRVNQRHPSEWLFVREEGFTEKPLTIRSVQRIISDACKEAGIKRRITPHSFRHAFVHRLAALGVQDSILAQLLGHSTPETVAQYTKLSRPETENYARRQFNELALAA